MNSKFLLPLVGLSLSLFTACAPAAQTAAAPLVPATAAPYTLQLLHFADVDGGRDITENAPRFSALVNHFRGLNEHTLLLSSGDNWIPGPEYNVAEDELLSGALGEPGAGRAHIAWLNALGLQASAVGNHDLDRGTKEFAELLAPHGAWNGADFPYLSANLDFATDKSTAGIAGKNGLSVDALAGKVAAYATARVGGETIGIVGASTPSLASITNTGGLTVGPSSAQDIDALAAIIQRDVDALTAQGVNKIILLAHMQTIHIEEALASKLRGVDIIVAGGSNTILADTTDRLRAGDVSQGEYPKRFVGADGKPVLLVNTDGDFTYLGRLKVGFDAQGVIMPSTLDVVENGIYAADEQGLRDLGLTLDDTSPAVRDISSALQAALQARAGNVLGYSNVYLNGERGSVRTEETNLGNLTADANLFYAQQVANNTVASLKNGGGIRGPIGQCIVPAGSNASAPVCSAPQGTAGVSGKGAISQLDLEIALRFNNELSLVDVTGAELAALLEHGVADVEQTGGRFPQVSGIEFAYDASAPVGQRVTDIVLTDANGAADGEPRVVLMQGGQLTEAAQQTYKLVTLSYLAGGGDGYPFPQQGTPLGKEGGEHKFDFAPTGTEQDALAEYLGRFYPSQTSAYDVADTPADQDRRIQRR